MICQGGESPRVEEKMSGNSIKGYGPVRNVSATMNVKILYVQTLQLFTKCAILYVSSIMSTFQLLKPHKQISGQAMTLVSFLYICSVFGLKIDNQEYKKFQLAE